MMSLNDVPRLVPIMFTVVPPLVGPLSGETLEIKGAGQLLDTVTKEEGAEQVSETSTQVEPHHPHWKSVSIL